MTELKNKQCPFCGEYIPLDSEICKYCKESLVNNIETRSTYQEKGTNEVVQPDSEEKRTHTHKKTPVKKVSTTKPKNETQKNDYTEEAENALF